MERNGSGLLRAVFAGIEPIILGLVFHWQRVVFIGIGNLLLILLRYRFSHHTSVTEKLFAEKKYYTSMFNSNLHGNDAVKKPTNFLGILALIALLGGIIVYFLLPYNLFAKLAGLLVGSGVIYRILAGLVHGFRRARRSIFGKLFTLAILLGLGRWRLGSPQAISLLSQKVFAPNNHITTGNIISGKNITGTNTTGMLATGVNLTGTTASGSVSGTIAGTPTSGATTQTSAVATLPAGPLSFAYVVPAIVKKFNLPTNGRDTTFTNISRSNELYPYFKAGYYDKFFGLNVNPNTKVSCNVYFVMLGLAQNRNVSYTPATVFSAYAKEAATRGQTYGCQPGGNVTAANLP